MLACASTFVVLKEGQQGFDPFIFSSLRFVVAALAFSPFWRRALRDDRVVRAGLEIGLWAAGGYITQSVSMVTAEASRAAFLSAFTVVVVPVLAGTFGGVRMKSLTWVSVAMALLGVALLEDSGAPPSWGDFWSFASAVLFGVQIYRTEHWSKLYGAKEALPVMSVALSCIAALAVLSTLLAHTHEAAIMLSNPMAVDRVIAAIALPWPSILYMGLFVTDLGLWAEVIALQHVSSTEAAIIYTLEPVCGAALAYTLLGERWGTLGWIGAVLIVGSCLLTQLYGAEKTED
jgi:drug/metabolite transporter (DMT)-like permease